MRNTPEKINSPLSPRSRILAILLLAAAGCSSDYFVEWGVTDHPGPSSCDKECMIRSDEEGEELWTCRAAFNEGASEQPIRGFEETASGIGWCREPGEDDTDDCNVTAHFVSALPIAEGTVATTGQAICNDLDKQCVTAQQGDGLPADCIEPLIIGPQTGANCSERCQ